MQASAFDQYAAAYDTHFTDSSIGQLQRERVYRLLHPLLTKPLNILELNCGTGTDAIWLAEQGNHVTATDVSSEMLNIAHNKNPGKLALVFQQVDLREPENLPIQNTDLVFSNFGGLNCLSPDELKKLALSLQKRIKIGARLALVIMGRQCLWEQFYFRIKRDARSTRRKNKDGVSTQIEGTNFLTWYYSPQEISTIFGDAFYVRKIEPIGLCIPPSYLEPFLTSKPILLRLLNIAEKLFAHGRWLADYADHYWIELERRVE